MHINKYLIVFYTIIFLISAPTLAFADEGDDDINSTETSNASPTPVANPMYTMGCIPEIALPMYPESRTCVAYYPLYILDFPSDDTEGDDTEVATSKEPSTTTTTTTTTTSSTQKTSSQSAPTAAPPTYYYPPTYYAPAYTPGPSPAAAFTTGLIIGGIWGAAYNNNNNDDNNNNTNTYYWNQWTGDNGSAGYIYGDDGGAYYWNYNSYSGGGYCYEGNCDRNNNWDGNTDNTTNTLGATRTHTPAANTTTPAPKETPAKKVNAQPKETRPDTLQANKPADRELTKPRLSNPEREVTREPVRERRR